MKIAFTPAVYEHAARFVGRTPGEVSRNAELLFQAHRGDYHSGIVACAESQRIFREIDRVLVFAGGCSNCLLGTGALPLETPPENICLIKAYLAT